MCSRYDSLLSQLWHSTLATQLSQLNSTPTFEMDPSSKEDLTSSCGTEWDPLSKEDLTSSCQIKTDPSPKEDLIFSCGLGRDPSLGEDLISSCQVKPEIMDYSKLVDLHIASQTREIPSVDRSVTRVPPSSTLLLASSDDAPQTKQNHFSTGS